MRTNKRKAAQAAEEKRRHLPLDAVKEAGLAAGLPSDALIARHYAARAWKVELLSPWGWPGVPYAEKVDKAREIADGLQKLGYVCAFDVLETGGFDCIFELV